ncbi:hypothetical protein [Micromonospora sp. NPDC050276]|uniref:hypothetical protein n=1 Tax=Micromonospora sp. NPDC050276 TaxID=3364278 RepID=UPI0037AA9576
MAVMARRSNQPLKAKAPSAEALTRWVKALSEPEKNDLVVRLMRGDDAHLRAELMARFHGTTPKGSTEAGRKAGELLVRRTLATTAAARPRA